jgi:hypothetical protein
VLAVQALNLELGRLAGLVREHAAASINTENHSQAELTEQEHGLRALIDAIEQFIIDLELGQLPQAQKGNLPIALRVTNYLEETLGLARDLDAHRTDIGAIMQGPVASAIASFLAAVTAQIERCEDGEELGIGGLEDGYESLRADWHELKSTMLEAAAMRAIPIGPLNSALEGLRSCLKMTEQLTKTSERLYALNLADDEDERPENTDADALS